MPGLQDMEDLLTRICSQASKDYMREALSCYSAGATRGCIVMTYIALFDDLRAKLKQLATVNASARVIFDDVELRANSQSIFETYMVEQLASTGFLEKGECEILELLRTRRNKAAHPSGIHASAEEARFVYFEVIDKFLSKEVLSAAGMVGGLIESLGNKNLFPGNGLPELKAITKYETAGLLPEARRQLIARLVSKCVDADSTTHRNARFLLYGLAGEAIESEEDYFRKYVLIPKSQDESYKDTISILVAFNPRLLLKINEVVRIRVENLLVKTVKEIDVSYAWSRPRHPIFLLRKLTEDATLGPANDLLPKWISAVLERFPYAPSLAAAVASHSALFDIWLDLVLKNAGSSTFDTANNFAKNISEIDTFVAAALTPAQAYELLAAIHSAASHGAFDSADLRASRYVTMPTIRDKARAYVTEETAAKNVILLRQGVQGGAALFEKTFVESEAATDEPHTDTEIEDGGAPTVE